MIAPELIAALVAAVIGLAATAIFERLARSRPRAVTVRLPNDRREDLVVAGNATPSDVAIEVRRAIDLEAQVRDVLSKRLESIGTIREPLGAGPDFILDVAGRTFAIEVKSRLSHMRAADMASYLKTNPKALKLFVMSPDLPSKRLLESTTRQLGVGKVEFVQLEEGQGIGAAIDAALRSAVRPDSRQFAG